MIRIRASRSIALRASAPISRRQPQSVLLFGVDLTAVETD